jgi:hypothetical protein
VQTFPARSITPLKATYLTRCGPNRLGSIEVQLQPFELAGEAVTTSLRLDQIELDLSDLAAVAGKFISFPINPAPGYIDGSIYLLHQHVPFDVDQIRFGQPDADSMPIEISGVLSFAAISDPTYDDPRITIATTLALPLSDERIERITAATIRAVGANSAKDIGKVMSLLSEQYGPGPDPTSSDRKRFAEVVRNQLNNPVATRTTPCQPNLKP